MSNSSSHSSQSVKRRVFRKKNRFYRQTLFRQIIESLIMFISGSYLLILINGVPNREQALSNINQGWQLVLQIVNNLIELLFLIGSGLLIICGIIIGIILVLGAFIRLIRIISMLIKNKYGH